MVLVRFGWIRKIPFICPCSLSPASTEKVDSSKNEEQNKKQKHNQNTESPKATRKIHHIKQQKQKKHKNGKQHQSKPGVWQVLIILCFPSLFFSVCSGFVCLRPCILYADQLFRLNKRGVWPKKAFGKTAAGKSIMFFFSSATWVSRKNTKSIKLGGQWIPADLWISKNRHTHVKCINLRVHGTLRNPGDAHRMVVQHVRKKCKGSGV